MRVFQLMFLPRALSAAADAANAVSRLEDLLKAETRNTERHIDASADLAIATVDASFAWLASPPEVAKKDKKGKKAAKDKKNADKGFKDGSNENEVTGTATALSSEPFRLSGLNLKVPRGKLVAVVGAVGSGKSSILSGLIGEMKQTGGSVKFGGKIAYCPQDAFIQNCSLRDNVLFGQSYDESKYWQVLSDSSLIPDCLLLPDGDQTEIGEKGINLSGGQKARVNCARTLYHEADILIFDDPLAALDAHVGQAIFDNAMRKSIDAGKTVLLVTHALHVCECPDAVTS